MFCDGYGCIGYGRCWMDYQCGGYVGGEYGVGWQVIGVDCYVYWYVLGQLYLVEGGVDVGQQVVVGGVVGIGDVVGDVLYGVVQFGVVIYQVDFYWIVYVYVWQFGFFEVVVDLV